jgi:hypothetical protein
VLLPHLGVGMDKKTPLEMLRHLGYNGPGWISLFPPILLDTISADLLLSFDPEDGNDLLAYYKSHAVSYLRFLRDRCIIGL